MPNYNLKMNNIFHRKSLIFVIAVSFSLFHLYTGLFGALAFIKQAAIHLGCALVLVFLLYPAKKTKTLDSESHEDIERRIPWYDYVLIIMTISSLFYLFFKFEYIQFERIRMVTPLLLPEYIFGMFIVIAVIEATRRTIGTFLSVTAIIFIFYTFIGPHLPGIFYHRGVSLNNFLDLQFLSTSGLFGVPIIISATYIVLFIIFGSFMLKTGFGEFICDVSTGLTGRARGGPAKVAIVSSAGFGTISGAGSANVAVTGTFTIPLMKKVGFKPHFAAAVEAAASTGGEIMPPIMGAAAFVMAQYSGVPYIEIIYHAAIPAILYFAAIFFQVDLRSAKMGIRGLRKEELPKWKERAKEYLHLVFPIIVLLWLMVRGFTAYFSVTWSIVILVILSFARKTTRISFRQILDALEEAAKSAVFVAVACALSGIVVGCIYQSGLGVRFTTLMVSFSSGNITLALFAAMIAGLILGMGMPVTPAYVLMIALVIPAIIQLGVNPIAAHLFAIYICRASLVTPPVAISAYVAAGIAGADMSKSGWTAFQLGFASFIVPFAFVYSPALLLIGTVSEIFLAIISALLGIYALSIGLEGWLFYRANIIERIIVIVAAVVLIFPGLLTDLIGLLLFAPVFVRQLYYKKSKILNSN